MSQPAFEIVNSILDIWKFAMEDSPDSIMYFCGRVRPDLFLAEIPYPGQSSG